MTSKMKRNKLLYYDIKDEKKQVAVLLTLKGIRAYNLLRSVFAPTKPKDLKFKELTTALEQHFSPKKSVISERFLFYKREQAPTESVPDYITVLRKLSEHCEFESFFGYCTERSISLWFEE